jgi:hypothetical protein
MKRKFYRPVWAVQQIVRHDRSYMTEDICEHGIGHPNREWMRLFQEKYDDSGIHGCDGCCSKNRGKKH